MSDSIKSYEEAAIKELNQLQEKYAGQPRVMCATSVGDDVFDFSKVTKDDIVFGVHGDRYIVAKARHIKTEEVRKCYLKYVNKYATLLQMSDDAINDFWKLKTTHKDRTVKLVQNPNFNEPSMYPHGKFSERFFDKDQVLGYQDKFAEKFAELCNKENLEEYQRINPEYIMNYDVTKENPHPLLEKMESMELDQENNQIVMKNQKGEEIGRMGLDGYNPFAIFVTEYCNNLRDLLIEKNKSYGNSALDPVRVFSSADSLEQIKVRIDDKLSRIQRGNNSFNEDTIQDLQGYLILLQYKLKQ